MTNAARLQELINRSNAGDWEGMASCLSIDAIQHAPTESLGATVVRLRGADAIIKDHRGAAEKLGMRWEVLNTAEAEDLVTALIVVDYGNGQRSLAGSVIRFDDDGLICELYSYVKPPTS
jgi:hypothetical protein